MAYADTAHMLSHRAGVIIFFLIVSEVVMMKGVRFVSRTLLEVAAVVPDVGIHSGLVHEAVVFLTAIAGVSNGCGGETVVKLFDMTKPRHAKVMVSFYVFSML